MRRSNANYAASSSLKVLKVYHPKLLIEIIYTNYFRTICFFVRFAYFANPLVKRTRSSLRPARCHLSRTWASAIAKPTIWNVLATDHWDRQLLTKVSFLGILHMLCDVVVGIWRGTTGGNYPFVGNSGNDSYKSRETPNSWGIPRYRKSVTSANIYGNGGNGLGLS